MKEDYKMIKILIDKNEFFYKRKKIDKTDFIKNSLFLAGKLESILEGEQKISINRFIDDEFSFVKFNLAICNLKAVIN